MTRVAVAVSGGADSLYVLLYLTGAGYDVCALHGRFLPMSPDAPDPLPGLRVACAALNVPLHCVDLTTFFDAAVVAPFVRAYARGDTPNPCALCNARVKFGALWEAALGLGAHTLATGHYAALADHPAYGRVLMRAADTDKDQSYFLALVPHERLSQALFPLAGVRKAEARAALHEAGIAVPLSQESQDICFVRGHYAEVVQAAATRLGIALGGPGPMLLDAGTPAERRVGEHGGLWRYTEGQRRGLGVAHSAPLYVAAKDGARNALLLGVADTRVTRCRARDVLAHVPPRLWPGEVWVKTRYRQTLAPATWQLDADGTALTLDFAAPQSHSAPGQIVAVYDVAGVLLAGGVLA